MEDYITQGAATIPAPQPDLDTSNIEIKKPDIMGTKQETSQQTSGGSMMGMPTSAIQDTKAAGASVPTAKEVATDQKVYGTANDPARASMWQPPVKKPNFQISKMPTVSAPEKVLQQREVETEQLNLIGGVDESEWQDLGNKLSEEDAGDFASAQAAIKQANDSGDKQEQKDVKDHYIGIANEELEKKANSKWPLFATIASIALFAFSEGTIPPVNFIALSGQKDAKEKWNELLQKNAEAETSSQAAVAGTQAAGEQKQSNEEAFKAGTEAQTEMTAAGQGKGSELGAKEMEQEFSNWAKKYKLTSEQEKAMALLKDELDTNSKLKLMDAQNKYTMAEKEQAAKLLAGQYADAMKAIGMEPTLENFRDYMLAYMGESRFTKNAGAITSIIDSAADIFKK